MENIALRIVTGTAEIAQNPTHAIHLQRSGAKHYPLPQRTIIVEVMMSAYPSNVNVSIMMNNVLVYEFLA